MWSCIGQSYVARIGPALESQERAPNMVIIMRPGASQAELDQVLAAVEESGFRPFINPGVERKVVALLGEVDIDKVELVDHFSNMAGVERVQLISEPLKLSPKH